MVLQEAALADARRSCARDRDNGNTDRPGSETIKHVFHESQLVQVFLSFGVRRVNQTNCRFVGLDAFGDGGVKTRPLAEVGLPVTAQDHV